MADWPGTLIGLFDIGVRVAAFANDLRSAQDDFIGLRAEAECLLICINSLNSPACLDSLYRFINAAQAADLKRLVESTELNMKELNQFLAKCRRVVELRAGTTARRKGVSKRVKEALAKAWARYRFVMKDKQAFRDKLVLPAQSINIYLTMLTHIGLVNVGGLMQLSGQGGEVGAGGGARGGVEGGVEGQGGVGGGAGGGAMVRVGPVDRWSAVGRRVAFKDSTLHDLELTTDIEEQIVNYALYLTRGGTPFHSQTHSDNRYRSTRGQQTRTRSRSRSDGVLGVEKRRKGQMYFVRKKKSVGSLSTERVDTEYGSGSETEGHAGRRPFLALPSPY
ncbi:hypothetical protein BKA65DRAFT_515931 [Rhexocercosporidium sp. MPI-PUGE-AT-0058]|nr:hypothetical protein BKA65DRAFT_515931 [Rhexocercosporidium sp. MPI-PUGE-AT-0058]